MMEKIMEKISDRSMANGLILALIVALIYLPQTLSADDDLATLRGSPLNVEKSSPRMNKKEVRELRTTRDYPDQPPIIPHSIRNYQIDMNTNKCLTCHSRKSVAQSQAVMVSVTHFVDREGQIRASVSPRRYFCLQCHVQQDEVMPKLGNIFKDVDEVIESLDGG